MKRSIVAASTMMLTLLALATPGALCAVTPPTAPVFAQENSDLRADPAAKFGTLKNGMRYVILHNAEPKNRASLRLVVVSGALQETEEQRGLAHFLEHMAFNGSTHYPSASLVEHLQRLGMGFGADTNAFTSFDRTQYMLELPDTKPETLADGLTVFADYAGGLLLEQKYVDKERGIILSEKRARDSVAYRNYIAEFGFILGKSRLPERLSIGLAPVIEQANRDRFVDYYNTWYRPERMAIVAVGDFDVAALEQQLIEKFSPVSARTDARPDPDLGEIATFDGLRALNHYEAESPATIVSIQILTPLAREPDTRAKRLADLSRTTALSMLNRRLEILAKSENSTFTRGSTQINDGFDFFRNASIKLICKPEQWDTALATAEQELRRALEHGFTPAELHEATANMLNYLEQAAKTAPTRHSDTLASDISNTLVTKEVFTTPADDLALLKPAITALTPEACLEALRAAWPSSGRYLSVIGNAKTGDTPEAAAAAITAAYEKAHSTPVAAPVKTENEKFAYTDFGPAGKITSRKHIDDLDIDLVTFENNVRLNIKKTDFEAGKILISVRAGGGLLTEPSTKPGLDAFSSTIFIAGGLEKHSADALERILAGRTVGTKFSADSDAFKLQASTNRDDLLLQLQLITAYITAPGYRPEALRQAKKSFDQVYLHLEHTPDGPLYTEVPRLLTGGDKRFGYPLKPEFETLTLDDARAWLAPQFANGPLEIAIVGDLDADTVIDAVSRTLGALPTRSSKPAYDAERHITVPAPEAKTFTISSEIPKGVIAFYWHTTDGRDVRIARRLNLLSAVFSDRLRVQVREKLGDTYSPFADSNTSDTFENYGFVFAFLVIDPAKADLLLKTVNEIADDLVKNGITDDELDRAKKPVLTGLRESARTNAYWLANVLSQAQESPQRLDWSRTRYTDNEAITKTELEALAKKYLAPENAFRMTIVPMAAEKAPKDAAQK